MPKSGLDWDAFETFVSEFKNESDRAAVILGAAKLDYLLGQILDRRMLPSLSSTDELLDGDSPLSALSARINACYRLGLINPDFAKALHLVRKIRNSFAHETSGCSLASGPHGDRVKALLLPLRPLPFFERFRAHFFGEDVSPSAEFKACLSMMAARLEARLNTTRQIESDHAWGFIKKPWADNKTTAADGPAEKA